MAAGKTKREWADAFSLPDQPMAAPCQPNAWTKSRSRYRFRAKTGAQYSMGVESLLARQRERRIHQPAGASADVPAMSEVRPRETSVDDRVIDVGREYQRAVDVAARRLDVSAREVVALDAYRFQPQDVITARRAAIYVAVVVHDLSLRAVGRVVGMSAEGVRCALRAIEDMRDDPSFDGLVANMEQELTDAA